MVLGLVGVVMVIGIGLAVGFGATAPRPALPPAQINGPVEYCRCVRTCSVQAGEDCGGLPYTVECAPVANGTVAQWLTDAAYNPDSCLGTCPCGANPCNVTSTPVLVCDAPPSVLTNVPFVVNCSATRDLGDDLGVIAADFGEYQPPTIFDRGIGSYIYATAGPRRYVVTARDLCKLTATQEFDVEVYAGDVCFDFYDNENPTDPNGPVDCADPTCEGRNQTCYNGPAGTVGVGLCVPGMQRCVMGFMTGCLGEVLPLPEVCDGLDNNCNNLTDEAFPLLGLACTVGIGGCASNGTVVCTVDTFGMVCSATAGQPANETCNYIDDNCNGLVDE
ncbi:MAG TPA: MopE-related protein, partial [Ramlibacter sp.]|nr:MopE-related protein [Ramlibacter sp.]